MLSSDLSSRVSKERETETEKKGEMGRGERGEDERLHLHRIGSSSECSLLSLFTKDTNNHFFRGLTSKYSHACGLGLQHMNFEGTQTLSPFVVQSLNYD